MGEHNQMSSVEYLFLICLASAITKLNSLVHYQRMFKVVLFLFLFLYFFCVWFFFFGGRILFFVCFLMCLLVLVLLVCVFFFMAGRHNIQIFHFQLQALWNKTKDDHFLVLLLFKIVAGEIWHWNFIFVYFGFAKCFLHLFYTFLSSDDKH